jgi:hypothetical protein
LDSVRALGCCRSLQGCEIGAAIAHELSLDPQKVVEIVLHAAAAAVEAAVLEVGQSGIKAQIGILAEYLYLLKVLRIDGRSE